MKLVNSMKSWQRYIALVIFASVLLATAGFLKVNALDRSGPDIDEFGNANVTYYLSHTPDVADAFTMSIPLYRSTKPTSDVTVSTWCDGRQRGVRITAPVSKVICATDSSAGTVNSFVVPASAFALDPNNTNYYRATLNLSLVGINNGSAKSTALKRGFRLTAPTGYIIGYSSSNSSRFAIMNQNRCDVSPTNPGGDATGCSRWFTYSLPFAAPCSASSARVALTLYDPDNGATANRYNAQYDRYITGYVQDIDDPGNTQNANIPKNAANGFSHTFNANLVQGHRYRLVLNNVYSNNVIQFKLPHDSINALTRCPTYDIQPSSIFSNGTHDSINELGEQVGLIERLNKAGSNPAGSSEWGVYQFVVRQGQTLPNFATRFNEGTFDYETATYGATQTACNWISGIYSQATGCNQVANGNSTVNATMTLSAPPINTNSYNYGDRVCRIVSVRNYAAGAPANDRRVSFPACVVIAKRPLINILGNDLRAGSALALTGNKQSRVTGSTATIDGDLRGSWVEYGIFAPGNVAAMASGSGLVNKPSGSPQAEWSKLTFANDGAYGQYASAPGMGVIPDVKRYFTNAVLPSYIKRINTNNTTIDSYTANRVVISSGTVTITDDITNDPSASITTGAGGISQMVIIANTINVNENVKNIDAWLIATGGTIDTCIRSGNQSLTTDICDEKLTITGPVQASTLKLRRTFGNKTEYAETVNLRADAYIWARHLSSQTGSWQPKYTTELPPRY